MSSSDQSPAAAQLSASQSCLKLLSGAGSSDSVANIILVGDISKPPSPNVWGLQTEFFWPGKIPSVKVYEFVYAEDDGNANKTRAEAVAALGKDICNQKLLQRSGELKRAICDSKERAILVGYGYGGLLCEQVVEAADDDERASSLIKGLVLFGTPHFVRGLKQWAHIVVETTARSEVRTSNRGGIIAAMSDTIGRAFTRGRVISVDLTPIEEHFRQIAKLQRSFFHKTRNDWWRARIVSCFPVPPMSSSEHTLTILPEWVTVPHSMPVSVRKPYLEMTDLSGLQDRPSQLISRLIGIWIQPRDGKATT